MPNIFDQFDEMNPQGGNIFDQFDSPPQTVSQWSPSNPRNPKAKPAAPLVGDDGKTQQWYEQPAPNDPKAPRGVTRNLTIGTQGVGRGVADTLGMPVDLAALALNTGVGMARGVGLDVPYIEKPIGGSDSIASVTEKIYNKLGGKTVGEQDMSAGDRLGYNVNRFGTGAMLGGAGLARTAAAEAAAGLKPALPTFKDAFLETYRKSPERAFAVDTAAGVGAGTGQTVADETAPESPLASLFGVLLGGMGGATTGGALVAGKEDVKSVGRSLTDGFKIDRNLPLDPVTGKPVNRSVADTVAEFLQGQASDIGSAKENLAKNAEFYAANGLPTPGTGALSNDVGLIGVERSARTEDPTPFLQRERELRTAQTGLIQKMKPDIPEESKRDAQKFAQQTADQERIAAQTQTSDARNNLNAATGRLEAAKQAEAETAAPVAAQRGMQGRASQELDKQIVEGGLDPATQAKNNAFDAIDPQKNIMRDASPVIATARMIKDSVGKLSPENSGLPAEFLQKLDALAPDIVETDSGLLDAAGKPIKTQKNVGGDGKVSLGDMLDARKHLNAAAEKAQQAGNFDLAENIRTMKKQINDEADRVIAEGGPGSKEAAAAKKAYEEDYAPYFAEGFGRKFRDKIQKDPTGRTQLPPSETAGFFLNNSDEAAKDLRRITSIAKDPAAAARAVGNYMKAQLANLVKSDGTLEPATMKKWLDNNRAALSEFPDVDAEMAQLYQDVLNGRSARNQAHNEVQSLAGRLKQAEADAAATEKRINNSALKVLIDNEPQNAAAKILSDGDPEARMKETLQLLSKNEPAKTAFRRAVADHLESVFTGTRTEQTGNDTFAMLQTKVEGYLKKPGIEKALIELYKDQPDAIANLRLAQRIGRDVAKVNIQATAGSATAENAARRSKFLVPVELIFKSAFGNLEGGGQMRRLKLAMSTIPGLNNDAAIQRLLIRAQFEPELAMHLYGRDVSQMPARLWTKKLNRLMGYAAASREMTDGNDE